MNPWLGQNLWAQAQADGWGEKIDHLARTPQSTIVIWVTLFTLLRVGLFFLIRNTPAHLRSGGYKVGTFFNEMLDAIIYAGIFVFLVIRPFLIQAFKIPSGSMVSTLLVQDYIVANKFIYRYTDPKEGDVVVFRPPIEAVLDPKQIDPDGQVNVDFIKRCIGVPGDVIEMKDNVVYRNGKPLDEPYKHLTILTDVANELYREKTPEEKAAEPRVDFKLVFYKGQYIPVSIEGDMVNGDPYHTAKKFLVPDGDPVETKALKDLKPAAIPKGYYLMMGDNRNNSYDGRAWGLVPRDAIVGRGEFIWLPISRMSRLHSDPGSVAVGKL